MILLAAACTEEPPSGPAVDMQAYSAALGDRASVPRDRIAACDAIGEPDLAGDCALVAAREAERMTPGSMEALCPLVPDGPWRHECWFELAEATRQRDPALAVTFCDRAGPFVQDCRQHLWQTLLWRIARSPGPLTDKIEEATVLQRRWQRLLGDDPALEPRFWRQFYRAGLTAGTLGCAPLAEPHRTRCADAASGLETEDL